MLKCHIFFASPTHKLSNVGGGGSTRFPFPPHNDQRFLRSGDWTSRSSTAWLATACSATCWTCSTACTPPGDLLVLVRGVWLTGAPSPQRSLPESCMRDIYASSRTFPCDDVWSDVSYHSAPFTHSKHKVEPTDFYIFSSTGPPTRANEAQGGPCLRRLSNQQPFPSTQIPDSDRRHILPPGIFPFLFLYLMIIVICWTWWFFSRAQTFDTQTLFVKSGCWMILYPNFRNSLFRSAVTPFVSVIGNSLRSKSSFLFILYLQFFSQDLQQSSIRLGIGELFSSGRKHSSKLFSNAPRLSQIWAGKGIPSRTISCFPSWRFYHSLLRDGQWSAILWTMAFGSIVDCITQPFCWSSFWPEMRASPIHCNVSYHCAFLTQNDILWLLWFMRVSEEANHS